MNALTPTDWTKHYAEVRMRLERGQPKKLVEVNPPSGCGSYSHRPQNSQGSSKTLAAQGANQSPLKPLGYYSPWTRAPMDIDWPRYQFPIRIPNESEMADMMLAMMMPPKTPIQDIIKAVAVEYKVAVGDILGQRRCASIVMPRQIAMWITRSARPDRSLPDIGRHFGGRDHTTVLHAVRKIEWMIADGRLTIPEPLLALTKPVGVEG